MKSITFVLALLVLVIDLVFALLGFIDWHTGGLIGGLAVAVMLDRVPASAA